MRRFSSTFGSFFIESTHCSKDFRPSSFEQANLGKKNTIKTNSELQASTVLCGEILLMKMCSLHWQKQYWL